MGAKAGPVVAVVVTTRAVWAFDLADFGVDIVGAVPQALPPLTMPSFQPIVLTAMVGPPSCSSVIGFVESISVAQTLAAKRRQRIDPDQELIGLGAANLGAAFTGGFPVTGGFSRSVVNFDAGARTPAAGIFTAVGLAIAALALTPLIFYLPKATLAATIIVAVLSWSISRSSKAAGRIPEPISPPCGNDPADARLWCRGRRFGGRADLDRYPPLQVVAPAHGRGRTGARHRALPQRRSPRRDTARHHPVRCASTKACISPMPAIWKTGSTT